LILEHVVLLLLNRTYSGNTEAKSVRFTYQRWSCHRPSLQVCLLPSRIQEVQPPEATCSLTHWYCHCI